MNHKYSVYLVWSSEDDAFIARVLELPGCFADGPTRQEALKNLDTVVAEWIETAKELGREVPQPTDARQLEEMMREFDRGLQQHVQREVETAVSRVLDNIARSQGQMLILGGGSHVLTGQTLDPSDWWKVKR